MKLFFWKRNKEIDQFARMVADELFSQVQPELMRDFFAGVANKKDSKSVESRLKGAEKQVAQFNIANKLGVYGKARLQLTILERLQELGYDKDIAKRVNDRMIMKAS